MSGLFPAYILRQFANDGRMLSGGLVYSYQSGTMTPKPLYADATLTTPLTNPVELDASGFKAMFMGDGAYRIWVKTAQGVEVAPFIDGLVASGTGGAGEGTNATFVLVKTYNDLRALASTPDVCYVAGRTSDGDGGQGWFQLVTGSTLTDDDGIVLTKGGGSYVYRRVFDSSIDPLWYGVKYDASIDQQTALLAAFAGSARYNMPVQICGVVQLEQNTTLPDYAAVHFSVDGLIRSGNGMTFYTNLLSVFSADRVAFGQGVSARISSQNVNGIRASWFECYTEEQALRWIDCCNNAQYATIAILDRGLSDFRADFILGKTLHVEQSAYIRIRGTNQTISVFAVDPDYLKTIFEIDSTVTSISFGATPARPEWFGADNSGATNSYRAICFAARTGLMELQPRKSYLSTTAWPVAPSVVEIIGNGAVLNFGATALQVPTLTIRDTIIRSSAANWLPAGGVLDARDSEFPPNYTVTQQDVSGCKITGDDRYPVSAGNPAAYNLHLPLLPSAQLLGTDADGKIQGAGDDLVLHSITGTGVRSTITTNQAQFSGLSYLQNRSPIQLLPAGSWLGASFCLCDTSAAGATFNFQTPDAYSATVFTIIASTRTNTLTLTIPAGYTWSDGTSGPQTFSPPALWHRRIDVFLSGTVYYITTSAL